MARFTKNPFPGVDVSQYASWPKVTLPSGEVYYQVPGHPGYVYDPVSSNATGDSVFRANPQQQITADATAAQQQTDAANAAKAASSPATQLGTLGAATAATVGIPLAIQHFFPTSLQTAQTNAANAIAAKSGGAIVPNANAAAQGATGNTGALFNGSAPTSTSAPFGSSAADTIPDATITNPAAGGAVSDIGYQGADSATQTFGVSGADPSVTALQGGDSTLGASTAADAATADSGISTLGAAGTGLGIAGGAYGLYQVGNNQNQSRVSGGVEGAASGASIGAAIGAPFLGIGAIPGAIIGGAIGGLAGAFTSGRKTTHQVQDDHTNDLAKLDPTNQGWQQYVAQSRQGFGAPPPDPSKPFDGQYATFNDYKAAGLQASDLINVYGNLRAYGSQWATLTPIQQQQVTQANINSGIYNSKQGDVDITDDVTAKQNLQNVLSGKVQPTSTTGSSTTGTVASQISPAVTTTPLVSTPMANTKMALTRPAGIPASPALTRPAVISPVTPNATIAAQSALGGGLANGFSFSPLGFNTNAPQQIIQAAPTNGLNIGGLVSSSMPGMIQQTPVATVLPPNNAVNAALGTIGNSPKVIAVPRTLTRSPGIALNGQRIVY